MDTTTIPTFKEIAKETYSNGLHVLTMYRFIDDETGTAKIVTNKAIANRYPEQELNEKLHGRNAIGAAAVLSFLVNGRLLGFLDIDQPHLLDTITQSFPDTAFYIVATPSGGYHLWFWHNETGTTNTAAYDANGNELLSLRVSGWGALAGSESREEGAGFYTAVSGDLMEAAYLDSADFERLQKLVQSIDETPAKPKKRSRINGNIKYNGDVLSDSRKAGLVGVWGKRIEGALNGSSHARLYNVGLSVGNVVNHPQWGESAVSVTDRLVSLLLNRLDGKDTKNKAGTLRDGIAAGVGSALDNRPAPKSTVKQKESAGSFTAGLASQINSKETKTNFNRLTSGKGETRLSLSKGEKLHGRIDYLSLIEQHTELQLNSGTGTGKTYSLANAELPRDTALIYVNPFKASAVQMREQYGFGVANGDETDIKQKTTSTLPAVNRTYESMKTAGYTRIIIICDEWHTQSERIFATGWSKVRGMIERGLFHGAVFASGTPLFALDTAHQINVESVNRETIYTLINPKDEKGKGSRIATAIKEATAIFTARPNATISVFINSKGDRLNQFIEGMKAAGIDSSQILILNADTKNERANVDAMQSQAIPAGVRLIVHTTTFSCSVNINTDIDFMVVVDHLPPHTLQQLAQRPRINAPQFVIISEAKHKADNASFEGFMKGNAITAGSIVDTLNKLSELDIEIFQPLAKTQLSSYETKTMTSYDKETGRFSVNTNGIKTKSVADRGNVTRYNATALHNDLSGFGWVYGGSKTVISELSEEVKEAAELTKAEKSEKRLQTLAGFYTLSVNEIEEIEQERDTAESNEAGMVLAVYDYLGGKITDNDGLEHGFKLDQNQRVPVAVSIVASLKSSTDSTRVSLKKRMNTMLIASAYNPVTAAVKDRFAIGDRFTSDQIHTALLAIVDGFPAVAVSLGVTAGSNGELTKHKAVLFVRDVLEMKPYKSNGERGWEAVSNDPLKTLIHSGYGKLLTRF